MRRPEFYQLPSLRKYIGLLLVGLNFADTLWSYAPIQFKLRGAEVGRVGVPYYFGGSFTLDIVCLILLATISSLLLLGAYYFATEKSGGMVKRICLFFAFLLLYFWLDGFITSLAGTEMVT